MSSGTSPSAFICCGDCSGHADPANCPRPRSITGSGKDQMRKNVPLLKRNDLRSGSITIQRELNRPEGCTRMLLPNGHRGAGSTNTGSGDNVLPGGRHLLRCSKALDRAIQWSLLKKMAGPGTALSSRSSSP